MSDSIIGKIGVILIFFLAVMLIMSSDLSQTQGRVYDCGMAEWHPDIPNSVKEECRRLKYEEWQKEQNKVHEKKTIRA